MSAAIKTFKTRQEAVAHIEAMDGWNAKPVQLYLAVEASYDPERGYTEYADQWVVECNGDKYLRTDGCVN
jgi:hypothetical protein